MAGAGSERRPAARMHNPHAALPSRGPLNPPFSLLIINSSVTRMKLALSIPDSGGAIRLKGGRDRGCKELDGDVHSKPDRLTGRKQGREAEMGEMHACGRGGGGGGVLGAGLTLNRARAEDAAGF